MTQIKIRTVKTSTARKTSSALRAFGALLSATCIFALTACGGAGTVEMANNWVSPNSAKFWIGHLSGARINGWSTNIGANNNPMLVNALAHDYRPAAGSPLVNAGAELGELWAPISEPAGTGAARKQDAAIDIGAFEH